MSEPQYLSIVLRIPKATLVRIHEHRLINPFQGANEEFKSTLWQDAPEIVEHLFGGRGGTQFSCIEDIENFLTSFQKIFDSRQIDRKHIYPILYMFLFLQEDDVQQSMDMNRFNRLLEYSRFIIDVMINCRSHMQMMLKNKAYQTIYDEYTNEYFFAKRELVDTMAHEDLLEFMPNEEQADDVVKYLRIQILGKELYVPKDLIANIASDRTLRDVEGTVIPRIELPARFMQEMLESTLRSMVDDHKNNDTAFYRELSKDTIDERELIRIYKQYRKRAYSQNKALLKVAIIISDYLKENQIFKTKADISKFLFEYFALFKVFRLKTKASLPNDYAEIIPFYLKHGISGETVRMMLKDAGEI
jgi:hypothetical protein